MQAECWKRFKARAYKCSEYFWAIWTWKTAEKRWTIFSVTFSYSKFFGHLRRLMPLNACSSRKESLEFGNTSQPFLYLNNMLVHIDIFHIQDFFFLNWYHNSFIYYSEIKLLPLLLLSLSGVTTLVLHFTWPLYHPRLNVLCLVLMGLLLPLFR